VPIGRVGSIVYKFTVHQWSINTEDTAEFGESMGQTKGGITKYRQQISFQLCYRKTIRNTNLIERVIREVRRRTKVMDNVIDNEYSLYALMTGIFQEQNERWKLKSHWSSK